MDRRVRNKTTRKRARAWRLLVKFLLCYGVLAGLFLVASLRFGPLRTLDAITDAVATARPYLHALQIATLFMLWWRWHALIEWMAKRSWVSVRAKPHVLAARNRIMLMLGAIQVLVVMGFPLRYW